MSDTLSPSAAADQRVGIIGTGNMGGGMALNLLARGWHVQIHDIDREKVDALAAHGAIVCTDAASAAATTFATMLASSSRSSTAFNVLGNTEDPRLDSRSLM